MTQAEIDGYFEHVNYRIVSLALGIYYLIAVTKYPGATVISHFKFENKDLKFSETSIRIVSNSAIDQALMYFRWLCEFIGISMGTNGIPKKKRISPPTHDVTIAIYKGIEAIQFDDLLKYRPKRYSSDEFRTILINVLRRSSTAVAHPTFGMLDIPNKDYIHALFSLLEIYRKRIYPEIMRAEFPTERVSYWLDLAQKI